MRNAALAGLGRTLLFVAFLLVAAAGCARLSVTDRAQSLVRQHREGDAVKMLREELAKHPDDVPARRLLVRVLAFTGDLEGARKEVEILQQERPNDPTAWIEMGHAFEIAKRFDEALAAYDTAAETAPTSPDGPREGGMRCARWGEPEEAEKRLAEAIKRGAKDAELFHVLGLVRVHLHDFDGAREAYRRGLAVDPRSSENLLGLATVAVVQGDAGAALAAYDNVLASRPHYAAAELGRAWALGKLGRKPEAEKALDHALAMGAPKANVDRLRAAVRADRLTGDGERALAPGERNDGDEGAR
ncbi:MAG: tetratricopeptide repeat protein [Labilithrix sp.]